MPEPKQKKMSPGQILGICADLAFEIEKKAGDMTLEGAQAALKNPKCRRDMLAILQNRGEMPPPFGRITTICPHREGESLIDSLDFLERGQKQTHGWSNHAAFEFYRRPEHRYLLPEKGGPIDQLVFVDTEFTPRGWVVMVVRTLCFDVTKDLWLPADSQVTEGFYGRNSAVGMPTFCA